MQLKYRVKLNSGWKLNVKVGPALVVSFDAAVTTLSDVQQTTQSTRQLERALGIVLPCNHITLNGKSYLETSKQHFF